MKNTFFNLKSFLFFVFISASYFSKAQCCFQSTTAGQGNVCVTLTPIAIVLPTNVPPCAFGFNYDINYKYTITTTGSVTIDNLSFTTTCSTGSTGTQTFSNTPLPHVAGTGNVTTVNNQFTSSTICATANLTNLGCLTNPPKINISGTGFNIISQSCALVLPIDFISFNAKMQNNGVYLVWEIGSVNNVKNMILQKSIDLSSWDDINTLSGGEIGQNKLYSYVDKTPIVKTVYYRLLETDNNGKISFSYAIAVNANTNGGAIKLIPNSGDGSMVTVVGLPNIEQWKINVFDLAGRQIKNTSYVNGKISLPTNIPSGSYIFQFLNTSNNNIETAKYFKL